MLNQRLNFAGLKVVRYVVRLPDGCWQTGINLSTSTQARVDEGHPVIEIEMVGTSLLNILASSASWVVVELDPDQIKFCAGNQIGHIVSRQATFGGGGQDIRLGRVISGHELAKPGNHGDVTFGRVWES
jgi:hypothetical protein